MNTDTTDNKNDVEQSVKELELSCAKPIGITLPKDPIISINNHPVHRQYFHVPSEWIKNQDFLDLAEHRYQNMNHVAAVNFIKERLTKLGYDDLDKNRMLHDYMHYLLIDMLAAADIPFITETEMIAEESALVTLFEGKTPDLIIKSGGGANNRPKPLIVDIRVGQTEEEAIIIMSEKKAIIYATMEVIFDFTSLTLINYNTQLLRRVFFERQPDVDYFHRQFVLFQAEYFYWHGCLKSQHHHNILSNDYNNNNNNRSNASIREFPTPTPAFNFSRNQFKTKLSEKAASLMNYED
eukprot:gene24288-31592_t